MRLMSKRKEEVQVGRNKTTAASALVGSPQRVSRGLEGSQRLVYGLRSRGNCMQLPLTKRVSHAMPTELNQHLAEAHTELGCAHVSAICRSGVVLVSQSR